MAAVSDETVFRATSADGTVVGCIVVGEGPPLVMVHGTGDSSNGFRRVRDLLAPHFTLYLMDRRGRGVSGDAEAYALEREYEDIAAVVDAIGAPVNLFAHSFGAVCAIEGALRACNLRRLGLYEPSLTRDAGGAKREETIDEMQRLVAEGDREGAIVIHLRNIIRASEDAIEKQRAQTEAWATRLAMAHTMGRELHALRTYDFVPDRFARLAIPVMFLVGEKTTGRGPEIARQLVATIPDARLQVVEGQGHFAMLTAPELFARKLIDFFAADGA